jgi:hypothetical protein
MSYRNKMRSNLVRAPGARLGFDQREISQAQQHAPIRLGRAAMREACGHARSALRIAGDRALDSSGIPGQPAMKQRDVRLFDCARAELFAENAMGDIIARYDHGPGGAAVQPVHDSRTKISANRRKRSEVMEQSVDERASRRPGSGVNDHSRRLIHGDDVFVLVEHVNWYLFGRSPQWRAGQNFNFYRVACHHQLRPACQAFADTNTALVDQFLNASAAEVRKARSEVEVETAAGILR